MNDLRKYFAQYLFMKILFLSNLLDVSAAQTSDDFTLMVTR